MASQKAKTDDGVGWIIQLVIGIGMLLLVTAGKSLLESQSAITIPMLWVVGIGLIAAALYSRLAPAKKPVKPAARDQW